MLQLYKYNKKGGKMEKPMLKFVYALFIGIMLAVFIGVGIDAFYPGPTAPESPAILNNIKSNDLTDEQIIAETEYNNKLKQYQEDQEPYSRNVSIITLIFAVIILVISLLFEKKLEIISEGLLLGGVFTLGYSIIRGFMSADPKYRFIVLTIGLIVAIGVGYMKFISPKESAVKKS
jgi:hypothetical protein